MYRVMPTISVMVANPMSGTPSMGLAMPAPVVKITSNPAFSASLAWKALVTPGAITIPGCSRSWRRRRRGFSDMGVPCRDRSVAGGPAGNRPGDVPAVAAGDQHLTLVLHHPLQRNASLVMALAQQHGQQGGHTGEAGAGAPDRPLLLHALA